MNRNKNDYGELESDYGDEMYDARSIDMSLICKLIKGYYYPSRIAGLSRWAAFINAIQLAIKCLKDKYSRAINKLS